MRHIFQLGYPGNMGGANTEAWHTVRLWREAGWDVTMIPTWGHDDYWENRLNSIGVSTVHVSVEDLEKVPGLPGSIVVGMCNQHFCRTKAKGQRWQNFARLKAMGCRTVWAPCMCFIFPHEQFTWSRYGVPDAMVFQSQFQRQRFELAIHNWGYSPEQGFTIRGAFWPDEFPFKPRRHAPGSGFTIGKLARPDADKWPKNLWEVIGGVPYERRQALAMGWNDTLEKKVGPPPDWATCLPPQDVSSTEFLSRCHCLLGINGGAQENWPRVGLEAMASGVPLITYDGWGWREMLQQQETGILCENDQEVQYWAAYLAHNESRRLEIAEAARVEVERVSNPLLLTSAWERLFKFVESREPAGCPAA